ncbi:YqhA family protein [Desulfovibrio sp. OttesenSCG-928-F20]|nr:YqhA family protein [Desulfovibrio sp. OttesenSCG-928-F20]
MRKLEELFEFFLFNSRIVTLLAVLGSLVAAVVMFIKGTMKIGNAVVLFWGQVTGTHEGAHGSEELVALLVSSVDIYLFATVLLIFSMGLYELFISKIDPASRTPDSRPNWLKIDDLDTLKGLLGKVILMILIVSFFEKSLSIDYQSALDLLYLGVGILLVSGALFLTHAGYTNHSDHEKDQKAEKGEA